ncbi:unnamed protein product [Boreogadus saida]
MQKAGLVRPLRLMMVALQAPSCHTRVPQSLEEKEMDVGGGSSVMPPAFLQWDQLIVPPCYLWPESHTHSYGALVAEGDFSKPISHKPGALDILRCLGPGAPVAPAPLVAGSLNLIVWPSLNKSPAVNLSSKSLLNTSDSVAAPLKVGQAVSSPVPNNMQMALSNACLHIFGIVHD